MLLFLWSCCHPGFGCLSKEVPSHVVVSLDQALNEGEIAEKRNPWRGYFLAPMSVCKPIVCFLVDGSEKCLVSSRLLPCMLACFIDTSMTLNAIRTLMRSSPSVPIGILLLPGSPMGVRQMIARELESDDENCASRIHFRTSRPHFAKWNHTQFKLDIAEFADGLLSCVSTSQIFFYGTEFDPICWLDSDTAVVSRHFFTSFTF